MAHPPPPQGTADTVSSLVGSSPVMVAQQLDAAAQLQALAVLGGIARKGAVAPAVAPSVVDALSKIAQAVGLQQQQQEEKVAGGAAAKASSPVLPRAARQLLLVGGLARRRAAVASNAAPPGFREVMSVVGELADAMGKVPTVAGEPAQTVTSRAIQAWAQRDSFSLQPLGM